MKLEVLATGSSGNCYLLHTSSGTIIIEAGVKWAEVLKRLNFKVNDIMCCLISHEHLDHAKYIKEFQKNGIKIITSEGTIQKTGVKYATKIKKGEHLTIGNVVISAFDTEHDAAEPLGFVIYDRKTKEKLLFATDTYYVKYKFKNLNYIMVECNYSIDILNNNIEAGVVHPSLAKRLLSSHFELSRVKEFIKANDNENLKNVVLLHMSAKNSNNERFKQEVGTITLADVKCAKKGLIIDLRTAYDI